MNLGPALRRSLVHRGILGLALLPLLLLGGLTGTWFIVTGRILDGIPAVQAQAAREGWMLQAGSPRRAGWPLAARVELPDLVATRPLGGTVVVWTAERLDLSIRPTTFRHIAIAPAGAGTLRLGEAAPLPLRADRAELLVPLDGTGSSRLAIDALSIGTENQGVHIARVDALIEPGVVSGEAGPILVAPALPAPFAGGATLTGRVVATPPIPLAATPGQSAMAWRDAGGRLSLPELHLEWGPLKLDGMLSGGLDPALQPFGEAGFRVTGALDVLEAASKAGLVQPGAAAAARAVLSLLTLAAHGGPVALPVILRDRTLTVARFALLRLPVLAWDPP